MEAIEEETSVMSGVTGTPNSSNQPIINETGRLEVTMKIGIYLFAPTIVTSRCYVFFFFSWICMMCAIL